MVKIFLKNVFGYFLVLKVEISVKEVWLER